MISSQDPAIDEGSLRLREYLGLLRARKWSILSITVLMVAGTITFSLLQTPIYESEAEVLVKTVDTSLSEQVPLPPNLETERKLVTSDAVAKIAARRLGVDPARADELLEALSVSVATNTEILEISFADPDPEEARLGAEAFAEGYLDYRRRQVIDDIVAASEAVQARINARGDQLADVNARIAQIEPAAQGNPDSDAAEELADLEADANALETQIAVLQQEAVDLSPPDTLSVGRVVGPADLPDSPASPNIIQNAILALIAGIALGIAVALLRERLDDRLRDREDLEFRLGAPVLAVVPRVTSWRRGKKPLLVSVTEPQSAAAESYKALRTSVQHFALQRDAKVILVTSASAGEGKTATTANLGVALAHAGKRTILVSADLRKPRVHRFFNVGSLPGLTGVLTNNKTPWEVMERDVGVDHLQILPSGAVPTNPAELLGSDQMGRLIASLREVADFVLLDTAPILPVADALTLSAFVDGVLFVADSGATTGKAVDHSLKQLQQVNAPVFGAILNNFDPGRAGPYYYSHYRYYSTYTQTDQSADRVKNGTTGIRRLSRR